MTMTDPPHKRRMQWPVIIPISLLCAALLAGGLWYWLVIWPKQVSKSRSHDFALTTSGLSHPVINTLDLTRYSDADGDLVADAPTSPSKLVDPPALNFSYVPIPADDDDPEKFKAVFTEFVKHLSDETGKPCSYSLFHSIDEMVKAMRDGQLQVAGFATGSVPIAVDLAGFVPTCKLAMRDGTASYHMQIIVPKDSAMKSLSDLRGHELTVTDPGSNSGYKAPLVLLRNSFNLEPERDYLLRYSGSHDRSISGIADDSYEAAAVAGDVLRRAVTHGQITADQFRVIYESELFPTAALGIAHNLKPELAEKIKKALYDFAWTGTGMEKEFGSSDETQFVPAKYKEDWALVRKIDDEIGTVYTIKAGPSTLP